MHMIVRCKVKNGHGCVSGKKFVIITSFHTIKQVRGQHNLSICIDHANKRFALLVMITELGAVLMIKLNLLFDHMK